MASGVRNTLEDVKESRDVYFVTISYEMPVAGTVHLYATSLEHAIQIMTDAHANMKEFKVIDVHKLTEAERKAMMITNNEPEEEVNIH